MEQSAGWRKSRYSSNNTACLEVGRIQDGAAVRDSKDRAAGYFTADRAQWSTFVAAVKADRFQQ
ncbi:DUF397 domain-containing protein [Saccharopolyspora pogona]|uniref:DUF397 domain-containing protein n=1 Tax=Saccharopolyspora pogona TaxID=333966 RepID=UPI0016865697|nr:DUF397 domain-containing protein [Saccharopolyspora pogona]